MTTFAAYVGMKQQTTGQIWQKLETFFSTILSDFMGPPLFVTLAEFSSGELWRPTRVSSAMEVELEPKCALLTNSRETIASKNFGP